MIKLGIWNWTKNPTPTVVRNLTSPKNLRLLATRLCNPVLNSQQLVHTNSGHISFPYIYGSLVVCVTPKNTHIMNDFLSTYAMISRLVLGSNNI